MKLSILATLGCCLVFAAAESHIDRVSHSKNGIGIVRIQLTPKDRRHHGSLVTNRYVTPCRAKKEIRILRVVPTI